MPLGCGLSVCKYILGFFNLLIFICGGAVLGVGIWIVADKSSVMKILKASESISGDAKVATLDSPTVLEQAAYILIVAGAVVFLLGFLGCCGAFHESKCMLGTYAFFLTLFLLVEVGAGIYAAVAKDKFQKDLKDTAVKLLRQYKGDKDAKDAVTVAWDELFADKECCGVNDYRDFEGFQWTNERDVKFPRSCCAKGVTSDIIGAIGGQACQKLPDVSGTLNYANRGCYDAIMEWAKKHLTIVIIVGIGLGLIQLLAVIFSCCLCCALDPK